MRLSNAIVVGAGIGGLASAIALARLGVAVTVLERADALKEVGAGIQISPNGLRVLKALGVARGLERRAIRARAVSLRRFEDEAEQAWLDLSEQSEPYLLVHRADLIAALLEAALHLNVSMEYGKEVVAASEGDVATLELSDGTTRRSELVVCADGVRSVLRNVVAGDTAEPKFTGQVAWRALIPNEMGHAPEARVTMGSRKHLVSYPLRNGRLINLVAVQERSEWIADGWNHTGDPDDLRAAFSDLTGDAERMLQAVEKAGIWGLHLHPVAAQWYAPGLALVGDAAHPMLPFLAQGANMALEDAWTLADCLERAPNGAELATYQERRKKRVTRVVNASAKNAGHYHLRPGPKRWVTHTGMRLLSKNAPNLLVGAYDWLYDFDVTMR